MFSYNPIRTYTVNFNIDSHNCQLAIKTNKLEPEVCDITLQSDTDLIESFHASMVMIPIIYHDFYVSTVSLFTSRLDIYLQFTGKLKSNSVRKVFNESVTFNCAKVREGVTIENKLLVYGIWHDDLNLLLTIIERQMLYKNKKHVKPYALIIGYNDYINEYIATKLVEVDEVLEKC